MGNHYFIGIPISEDKRDEFADLQKLLKHDMSYKNWTHPDDFHITLKFLGACESTPLEKIEQQLMGYSWPEPFELSLGPADTFGKRERPRVFHISVEASSSLMMIQEGVEQICEQAGFAKEKRAYSPHVTLAKKWVDGQCPLMDEEVDPLFMSNYLMDVDRFCLYRIHPQQTPKYEAVCEVRLQRGGEV
ncbi:RNA 2',3'-cyclic phosphodiesterase [Halobacillus naozhouensis]|uniref:RNA 2',3'-cyclic phosphodiesterase n=1 Tax=Halobacillus naozhouensis TaxID=554880 RepID=A0ABY8IUR6_9BACI|nr:RNA 2',3'-cyclic phosphodiesterase [Halobacillus naozhouensis]WFT73537.1 RNA 2',3'-cyclic phosphodiesterase [Halobacillus naozhouensis]